MDDAFEGRPNPVVVFSRDGIELMVMAFRAVDRQAQEGAPGGGDHVVERGGTDDLLGVLVLIADVVVRSRHEEGAADLDLGIKFPDDVAGEVFTNQLIERLVVVERADDVISERIEVIDDEVTFEPVALTKAHDVKPVATPALTVARGGE